MRVTRHVNVYIFMYTSCIDFDFFNFQWKWKCGKARGVAVRNAVPLVYSPYGFYNTVFLITFFSIRRLDV